MCDSEQHQNPALDFAGDLTIDCHGSSRDPLHNGTHAKQCTFGTRDWRRSHLDQRGSVSKVSFRGVFVGAITDIVATDLLNIPLVMYEISKHDTSNLPKEQAHATLVAVWHGDT